MKIDTTRCKIISINICKINTRYANSNEQPVGIKSKNAFFRLECTL